jgi:hypothetical protein
VSLHEFIRREPIGCHIELIVIRCSWTKFEIVISRPSHGFCAPLELCESPMVSRINGDFQVIRLAITLRVEKIFIQVSDE